MNEQSTYLIRYRDDSPGAPVFTWRTRAYSAEHAEEKFLDSPDGEGWKVLEVERVRERDPRT